MTSRGSLSLDVIDDRTPALGFRPALRVTGPVAELTGDLVTDLLAVLTEALTNVARYARAGSVQVDLETIVDHLTLLVHDDGIGLAGAPEIRGTGRPAPPGRLARRHPGGAARTDRGHPADLGGAAAAGRASATTAELTADPRNGSGAWRSTVARAARGRHSRGRGASVDGVQPERDRPRHPGPLLPPLDGRGAVLIRDAVV